MLGACAEPHPRPRTLHLRHANVSHAKHLVLFACVFKTALVMSLFLRKIVPRY